MLHAHRAARKAAAFALLLTLFAFAAGTAAAATEDDGKTVPAGPVNLNRASAEQLTTIPGIGEAMARRIIEWRKQNGPFRRVEDLMKVKGIGEKSLEKMRPHVTVSEEG